MEPAPSQENVQAPRTWVPTPNAARPCARRSCPEHGVLPTARHGALYTRRTLCPSVTAENRKIHAIERSIDASDFLSRKRHLGGFKVLPQALGLALPGMGMIHGFLQSIHASEI